ncbi:conserved protein of unknown function [Georgfuchsia toluolica]|uniref:DUF2946 family protein n=1 Tax=Georgfuchsia toluolica TaxID=424218 RepID=A0A916J2A1_9PROT|nr:DUF2946 family protein [Georgfuchsia toluolica]CAG4882674.1 conserved protein of unknown function [Georgfuchsia toluolica]
MADPAIAALARWPNVPHVYGWLSLDRRGQWRLQGSPITNPHITEFIGRNYASDEHGAWFFQNGPQRVYVKLDYTPWILRIGEQQMLTTHTGQAIQAASAALLDESGNLLIAFERGISLVEDHDLPALLDALHDPAGKTAGEEALVFVMSRERVPLTLDWQALHLPLAPVRSSDIPARFGFIADPQPAPDPK